ncbi:hypothetical protein V1514DRAFT_363619 [Lipomyces japonicus]|uniref:uncharacterized protein n=1 Tax=Lipomyces japonicus TaxID=56871 RepID=UPI0034CEA1C5
MSASEKASSDTLTDPAYLVKVSYQDSVRRFKIVKSAFTPTTFPTYIKSLLEIDADKDIVIERFSITNKGFVQVDDKSSYALLRSAMGVKGKAKLNIADAPISQTNSDKKSEQKDKAVKPVSSVSATLESNETLELIKKMIHDEVTILGDELKSSLTLNATPEVAKNSVSEEESPAQCGFVVACDACDKNITSGTYYHCNQCNDGDYDVCTDCVNSGKHCLNGSHYLRAFTSEFKPHGPHALQHGFGSSRSGGRNHGHGPGRGHGHGHGHDHDHGYHHGHARGHSDGSFHHRKHGRHDLEAESDGNRKKGFFHHHHGRHGRHGRHERGDEATNEDVTHCAWCDGCNKTIRGTRHKCVHCPDFDYCSDCFANVATTHPGHNFVEINVPVKYYRATTVQSSIENVTRHFGVLCDGPVCVNQKNCIIGVRYKCAVCPDYDLCENCEALPLLNHDRSHPLIKLRMPLRHLTVDAIVNDQQATAAVPAHDIEPVTADLTEFEVNEKPSSVPKSLSEVVSQDEPAAKSNDEQALSALFVTQAVRDGQTYEPGEHFFQSWSLKNTGPTAWPVGVTIVFVSGDNMLSGNDKGEYNVSVTQSRVEPGEPACFTVMLQAPSAPGRFVSYWKVITADGVRFGDNLWCEINVATATAAAIAGNQISEEQGSSVNSSQVLFPVLNVPDKVLSVASSIVVAPASDVTDTKIVVDRDNTEQQQQHQEQQQQQQQQQNNDDEIASTTESTISAAELDELMEEFELVDESDTGSNW